LANKSLENIHQILQTLSFMVDGALTSVSNLWSVTKKWTSYFHSPRSKNIKILPPEQKLLKYLNPPWNICLYQNMPMGIVKYSDQLQILTQHQVLLLVINNDVLIQL